MIVANNDEEKRSELWRVAIVVTTVLIILITAFFVIKLFSSNPIEGTWQHQDSNLTLTIKGNGNMLVNWDKLFEEKNVDVGMNYVLDKSRKTVTFKIDEAAIKKAVKASGDEVTTEELRQNLETLDTTYDYSVDRARLTLTEREYGDQMVFDKK